MEATAVIAGSGTRHPGRHRRPPWWRRPVPATVAVVTLVVLVLAAWFAVRAHQAASALRSIGDTVEEVRAEVAAGRLTGLTSSARSLHDDATTAVAATSDPVWSLAERLPVLGVDVAAVRTVVEAVDELSTGVVTPLAEVAAGLSVDVLRPVDGRIDTGPLIAAAPVLADATESTDRARRGVDALDPAELHGSLPGAVTDLQRHLATARGVLTQASQIATVLPPMLGSAEPRSYLTLFLNSGELRTQGGIVGALAVVTVDDGRLELTQQANTGDVDPWEEPVLPLTDPEVAMASEHVGRFIQNVTMLPETPRVGQLAAEMWRRTTGQSVDGVVTVDPVALSYVLRATGGITHPDGEVLDAETLVQELLVDTYRDESDPLGPDKFFAGAAVAAFHTLAAGIGEPRALLDAASQAVLERRLSVWSAHPEEQEQITGTPLDGALLSGGHDDAVGVFLDNTSGWKTDSFLRTSVSTESVTCSDGRVTMDVRLELTSTLPADPADLPRYVVGDGSTGVPVGSMRMRVSVYAPVGGSVDQIRRDEAFLGPQGTTIAGRQARVMTQTLGPGQTATYVFTVSAPARGDVVPLWSTPTTSSPGLTTVPTGCPAS